MLRAASLDDLQAVEALTAEAYAPYTRLLGRPPIPVTEDYTPRIGRGEVWLREVQGELAGLAVVERHPDHVMLFSIAVSPKFQGAQYGLAILRWVEETAREWGFRKFVSTRMLAWNGILRSTGRLAFRKRVAARIRIGQDG
jgi:GNAT superfamily N-acetyltransferase